MADGDVKSLAKKVLRYPPHFSDSLIPPSFLKELSKQIAIFPDDTNFYVYPEPNAGFGYAVCLENNCGGELAKIKLKPNSNDSDGGKKYGLGSLLEYRRHINEHPTHKASRKERLSCSSGNTRASSVASVNSSQGQRPRLRMLQSLDPVDRSASSTPPKSVSPMNQPGPSSLAPEQNVIPYRPRNPEVIPRKRLFDDLAPKELSINTGLRRATPDNQQCDIPPLKRVKVEENPAFVPNKITGPSSSGLNLVPAKKAISPAQIRQHLAAERQKLAVQELTASSILQSGFNEAMNSMPGQSNGENLRRHRLQQVQRAIDMAKFNITNLEGLLERAKPDVNNGGDTSVDASDANTAASSPISTPVPWFNAESKVKKEESMDIDPPNIQVPVASGSRNPFDYREVARNIVNTYVDPMAMRFADLANRHAGPAGPMDVMFRDDGDSDDEGDYDNDYWRRVGGEREVPMSSEDVRKFVMEANNEDFGDSAPVQRSCERLGLTSTKQKIPGLTVELLAHQIIGVAWMLDKERSNLKGGILADEMGLGKTVQAIALLCKNPSDDPAVKTTLICAPLSLLSQWKAEIEDRTDIGMRVLIYHGPSKTRSKKELKKHDVVLTTFETLAREWPDYDKEIKLLELRKRKAKRDVDGFIVTESEDDIEIKRKPAKPGLLLQMEWYRVILDEAQGIRNKRTRVSNAVHQLESTYRWCLTGTPIINSLEDAYGPFRFLRLRTWGDFKQFHMRIGKTAKKEPALATRRLQAVFNTCLLRRKKDSLIDGKPIIILPPRDIQLVKLEFSPDERSIYDMVEQKQQIRFNKMLRDGSVLKNYANVLVMLLRLRQICSHSALIAEGNVFVMDEDAADREEMTDERERARKIMGEQWVEDVRTKFRTEALALMEAEKNKENAEADFECPICFDVFADPVLTSCRHNFCRKCIEDVLGADNGKICPVCRADINNNRIFSRRAFEPSDDELGIIKEEDKLDEEPKSSTSNNAAKKEEDEEELPDVAELLTGSARESRRRCLAAKAKNTAKIKAKCKKRAAASRKKRTIADSDEEEDSADGIESDDSLNDFIVEDDEDEEEKDRRRAERKRLGKKRERLAPTSDHESDLESEYGQGIVCADRDLPGKVNLMSKTLPSTKMKHMMESLSRCIEDHPDEKTIVISQWTSCLELASSYLSSKDIHHVMFVGSMKRESREKAIETFVRPTRRRFPVMLMSLKCGGVGLNLTRANRIINLDLGWSEAVENQAFDRVHRLGQTRPVFVERLVIKNTIEDRVLALQEKKRVLADGSLGEGNGRKIGRLSVRELANLFGLDMNGNRI